MIATISQNIDETPMRNFYSQDGEAEILVPAMCEEVQAAFQESNTDFVKGPPSATAKHLANDASAAFKDTKAGVAKVTRHQIDTSNPTLAAHVREAVAELKVAFPNAVITSPNVAKIIAAVETLSWVMKNGYVTQKKIVDSYKVRSTILHKSIFCATKLYIIFNLPPHLGLWPACNTLSSQHKENRRRLRQCYCLPRDNHEPVLLPHNYRCDGSHVPPCP
jgi:hypothetical protein